MARKHTSASNAGPADDAPATVTIDYVEGDLVAHIRVLDPAAFEFADRLADRGTIAPLEKLITDAIVAYVDAPDNLIRELERGTRRRVKKSAKPSTNKPTTTQPQTTQPPAAESPNPQPHPAGPQTALPPRRPAPTNPPSSALPPRPPAPANPQPPAPAGPARNDPSDHRWPPDNLPYR